MALTLDGTLGETLPTWSTAGRPASPTTGLTGYNTTLSIREVWNGTAWTADSLPAASTSGNLLTSDGTNWTSAAAPASGGVTLLGTITPTAVNSVSLSGLTLTNYKMLYISYNGVPATKNSFAYISASNIQANGNISFGTNGTGTAFYGNLWIELATGAMGGTINLATPTPVAALGNIILAGGTTDITTASTTVYLRMDATTNWGTTGNFKIYGVK